MKHFHLDTTLLVLPFLTFLYIYICIYLFFYDLFDINMNRNHRNRGGQQGHHNHRPARHTRNNPLYDDLFDTSRAPSEASSDSLQAIATPRRGELIDAPLPVKIVR